MLFDGGCVCDRDLPSAVRLRPGGRGLMLRRKIIVSARYWSKVSGAQGEFRLARLDPRLRGLKVACECVAGEGVAGT